MNGGSHLYASLANFQKVGNSDRETMIKSIRHDLATMLKNSEDFSFLSKQIPSTKMQYRTLMWNILLGLGEIDEHEGDKYITAYHYLSTTDQKKLLGELTRITNAQKLDSVKTDYQAYCSFLVLLAGFLSQSGSQYPLHQPLLTFGQVFLQTYTYPLAFFAFRQFVNHYAPHCFPRKGEKTVQTGPSQLAVQIAYEFDPTLKEIFGRLCPEYGFSFSHISSFFTQMKQTDQVSIVFDFLFAYGAFMVIFIEAGWMYINRDTDIKNNLILASSMPDALVVIRQAVKILASTSPENIAKAKAFYTV
ncbi:hypothetical protein TVAG_453910 [Trichomonas vaginalis G3]|uniref:Rab-GAP TBC domain-containing protein n=1 Tax=Trichomonas vaginalis (strain ATCC PRA-98 / G3) TaxID=412133 RepID=A2DPW7_TRIV3|nr:hypothetical protein TVAGG3_0552390 [Trichomonas vaginalis G3]EAY17563.1 hypothetical protein TVAG_453910 [Trichomonas vaginalis G3]KAI5520607.1 hypothetical protein TVAGG3_0552390 [Trichomonas vaginalis G3]|eukprot:XP_001329698.1 hypothetical protein [Trichomonas vaginalis G3]